MSEMRREDDGNQRPLGNSSNDIEPFSPRRDALPRAVSSIPFISLVLCRL